MNSWAYLAIFGFLVLYFFVFQGATLHLMSVRMRFRDAGIKKTARVFGLLLLAAIVLQAVWALVYLSNGPVGIVSLVLWVVSTSVSIVIIMKQYGQRFAASIGVLFVLVLVGLSLAIPARMYVLQAFRIPTGSMSPALISNDLVFASKFDYMVFEPRRGDIVVFRAPSDPNLFYTKRVVGLPGETFEIRDGQLHVGGRPIEDPWGDFQPTMRRGETSRRWDDFGPLEIPHNEFFLLGDNRNNSVDSRLFGPVGREDFVGRVVLRYWPLGRAGGVK